MNIDIYAIFMNRDICYEGKGQDAVRIRKMGRRDFGLGVEGEPV